jgi:hypothetical protein
MRWIIGALAMLIGAYMGDVSDCLLALAIWMLYHPDTFGKGAK